ncbi:MAG TPA: ABC transporter permease [Blastocatellia bacterium]|nr:ABC transporter permease [Blastocatellia bacterium]
MVGSTQTTRFRFWLWLIRLIGVIVPRRLRANWRLEWEAELRHREEMLAEWDRLGWRNKIDLLRRSTSAFWDALWLQPKRLEDEMFQDLRYGLRLLLKSPNFTLIAVFTLALGICGVTTQFSVVDAALLRGLPFPEPDRLVRVTMRDPSWAPEREFSLSAADVLEIAPKLQSFEGLAQYFFAGSFIVTIHDTPQRLSGSHVTSNFFSLLGVKPALGRDFTESDNQPGVERVTIISDALWQSEFGGDLNILGRKISRLNGQPATVIGVMPPGFQFPRDQLWIPIFNEYGSFQKRPGGGANLLGRLKPGVSVNQATSELEVYLQALAKEYPQTNGRYTEARITPLLFGFVGRPTRQLLIAMFGAVIAVLLIACANVMNMQFARATARSRELATRAALGASRGRLMRQMLVESLVLVALGGAAGALLAQWAIGLFAGVMGTLPTGALPSWMLFKIDGRVLGFTVTATALSVIFSGLLPALAAARAQPMEALKESSRGHTSRLVRRFTSGLVVGQIALTCALLISSLLLIKSITRQFDLNFGFDLDGVLAGRMNFEAEYRDDDERRAAFRRILTHLRSSPQFTHAAFTTRRNMMTSETFHGEIEGRTYARPEDRLESWMEFVSDGYFAALGLRPVAGREFEPDDRGARQFVVLVNESFARKHFRNESPLGHRVRAREGDTWRTIIGVVPDTMMQGPLEQQRDGSAIFVPTEALPMGYLTLVARGREPAERLTNALRRELAKVEPNLAIYSLETPKKHLKAALAQGRTVASLFAIFGAVSIALAAVGLYGVMSFAVSRRTQEFGVRLALGAKRRDIMKMVMAEGGRQLALGVSLGIGLALSLVQLGGAAVTGFLYKVNPHDPLVYVGVVALLALATSMACFFPARRATKVDPMVALRRG